MTEGALDFQDRVWIWGTRCFGHELFSNLAERNARFLEESLELIQSCGATAEDAHAMVDYVFSRPSGDKKQEVGGVVVTLAALCMAQAVSMDECADVELMRIEQRIDAIRVKQAGKPKHLAPGNPQ